MRRQLSPEFGCIERMCKTMRKVTFAFDGLAYTLILYLEPVNPTGGRFIEGGKPPLYLDHEANVHETFFFLKLFRSSSPHNSVTSVVEFCGRESTGSRF